MRAETTWPRALLLDFYGTVVEEDHALLATICDQVARASSPARSNRFSSSGADPREEVTPPVRSNRFSGSGADPSTEVTPPVHSNRFSGSGAVPEEDPQPVRSDRFSGPGKDPDAEGTPPVRSNRFSGSSVTPREVSAYWGQRFRTICAESHGHAFRTQREVVRASL
jgi:hypothetical protein